MSRYALSAIALAAAVFFGVHLAVRPSTVEAEAAVELMLPGLGEPVDVYRDNKGTPHIFAKTDDDVYLAYGYVSAEDRLFQMDYLRRVSAGRVAEIRGPEFIERDKYFRTVGYRKLAEEVVAKSDPDTRKMLQQFSNGVNAYINAHRNNLPVEFKQLGYTPEPWTPVDSMLAWYDLSNALDAGRWQAKVTNEKVLAKYGKDGEALLPMNDTSATILQPGEMPNLTQTSRTVAHSFTGRLTDDAMLGSNNWVVSGKKSVTGRALLASDPHLRITAPSVWHEARLKGDKIDVTGVTLPGTPFVVIGHNARIAWAVTWSTVDVVDVYEERINSNNQYEYMGRWLPMDVRPETILVKGGSPVSISVRSTRHGPLMTDAVPQAGGKHYSLRWTNHDIKADEAAAYRLINSATNWQEFVAGVRHHNTLSFNFIYADVAGNIGYYLGTAIPIRKKGLGTVPVPGWTDEYDWKGYVPFEENPHVYNPERGWIATANNRIAGDWYPYYTSYPGNTRSFRIHEMLQSKDKFSLDDFKQMQSDTRSPVPAAMVPVVLKAYESRTPSPEVRNALDRLRTWKFTFDRQSTAATIFDAFSSQLSEKTFGDEAGDDRQLIRGGNLAQLMISSSNAGWWDDVSTPARETMNDVIAKSLEEAVSELTKQFGPNQDDWQWEKKNTIDIPYHQPVGSNLRALSDEHKLGPFLKEGRGGWTVNPVATNSYRMLVDLSDLDKTETQLPPGNSGNPASPHFKDQTEMWVNSEYKPQPFSRDKIVRASSSHVVLRP